MYEFKWVSQNLVRNLRPSKHMQHVFKFVLLFILHILGHHRYILFQHSFLTQLAPDAQKCVPMKMYVYVDSLLVIFKQPKQTVK